MWSVNIESEKEAWEKDGSAMPNIWELFHGSSTSNLLSILKGGLVIPSASSPHVTGRLYGNGVYASKTSTKALNYSVGYWGGIRSNRVFMFVLDMAMGKHYIPSRSNYTSVRYPVKGYDSTFAEPYKSGVYNDECIVYRTSQVHLKYLIEFE
jgi:poly [ADP-ribose] polymerase